jgi:transcriptional regulator with GAF, ATPase, and Fis domain
MIIAEGPEPVHGADGSVSVYDETSAELLCTIAAVLDIRPVLPRLSEIANRVLPHDALALGFLDGDGQLVIQGATGDLADVEPDRVEMPFRDELIIGDMTSEEWPVACRTNPIQRLVGRGYRSLLTTSTRAGDQVLGVGFWSKRRHAYERRHVPLARWILDHIAVAVSHERLATTARAGADAHGRATPLDSGRRPIVNGSCLAPHTRIVGQSAEWQAALAKATLVARTETTVLLSGESGTGKEVVARFIHRASARSSGPFVALNCAALPEQLLESELFGYERGAFTGAQQAKPGQIELAAGGVLFLDEISEMSLPAQAKFLRVLQEREFQRLGGTRPLKANIRVVAATNRDLRKAIAEGAFREDLFYRLQVFDIRIAPLRHRRADVLPLSEAFLQEIGRAFGRPPAVLTREAHQALLGYDWPGNVRELRNALERAAIVCEDGLIQPADLSLECPVKAVRSDTTDLGTIERDMIAKVLRNCRWNKADAARRLGLSRTQLYVRMRRYSLEHAVPA